jgi:RNA polymerase sigma-70 factor (ECF subfamily)
MIRFARARLRKMGDANYLADSEDIVQNAFVKIIKYIDAIDLGRSEKQVKIYLMSIVVNEINTFLSKKASVVGLDEIAETEDIDDTFYEQLQLQDCRQSILDAMRSLDSKYLAVLWYRYYKNYSVEQIARLIGITEKAVYTRLLRAKKMLIEQLGKENLSK